MTEQEKKELSVFMAESEMKKGPSEKADELFKTRGRDFCIGLIIHLIMHVTGKYN